MGQLISNQTLSAFRFEKHSFGLTSRALKLNLKKPVFLVIYYY